MAKINEADEHAIELFKAGENSAKSSQAPKQTLYLISALIDFSVIFSGIDASPQRRNHWDKAQVQRKLTGFVALVSTIHQQMQRSSLLAQLAKQVATCRCVVCLPG